MWVKRGDSGRDRLRQATPATPSRGARSLVANPQALQMQCRLAKNHHQYQLPHIPQSAAGHGLLGVMISGPGPYECLIHTAIGGWMGHSSAKVPDSCSWPTDPGAAGALPAVY
jgi:hypothetical protein